VKSISHVILFAGGSVPAASHALKGAGAEMSITARPRLDQAAGTLSAKRWCRLTPPAVVLVLMFYPLP